MWCRPKRLNYWKSIILLAALLASYHIVHQWGEPTSRHSRPSFRNRQPGLPTVEDEYNADISFNSAVRYSGDRPAAIGHRRGRVIRPHANFEHMHVYPLLTQRDDDPYITESRLLEEVQTIWDLDDSLTWRMGCPDQNRLGARYHMLRQTARDHPEGKVKYLFALDLFQVRGLLPRLMGTVVQVIKALGPQKCALSIVEGRSTDGTYVVLESLLRNVKEMGTKVYLQQSDVDPHGPDVDRIEMLAILRNLALEPLIQESDVYSGDTITVFVNDVAVCPDDIYELLFQHIYQNAHQTCAMDYISGGATFYDSWVSRSMSGDLFFEVPQDASWAYQDNLFWDHAPTREKYDRGQSFQVYSCWGGMVTLDSTPFLNGTIAFRRSKPEECYAGEPTLLARDMWKIGKAHILTVPTVSLAYNNPDGEKTKRRHGWVHDRVDVTAIEMGRTTEKIQWLEMPPGQVKCLPNFGQPSWTDPFDSEGKSGGENEES